MKAENTIAIITLILTSIAIAIMWIFNEKEDKQIEAILIKHPECTMATRPKTCLKYNIKLERLTNDMENN